MSEFDEYLTEVLTADPKQEEKQELQPPSKYVVILHNDDFTPMNFVVMILMKYFEHSLDSAAMIMMEVHKHGTGIAGIYTKDIAETKAAWAQNHARQEEHPLLITIEPTPDE
jgi:ATP-dependent Clp protease adaptor protein ClpS